METRYNPDEQNQRDHGEIMPKRMTTVSMLKGLECQIRVCSNHQDVIWQLPEEFPCCGNGEAVE